MSNIKSYAIEFITATTTSIQFNGMTFQGDGTSGTQTFNVKGTDLLNVTYANFVNLTS